MKAHPLLKRLTGAFAATIAVGAFFVRGLPAEDFSVRAKRPVAEAIEIRQQTQEAEDRWAAEKERLGARYDMLKKEHKRLTAANARLQEETDHTAAEIKIMRKRIVDAARISKEMHPYLVSVADALKKRLNSDAPFLYEERSSRINALHATLSDPNIDISEKYRKTMEAVFVEAEYGNTIEVYSEKITVDAQKVQAKVLRFGRVSLFFQTLDHSRCGVFDVYEERWQYLPEKFNRDVGTAVEMGLKRRPVDLVDLPLGRIAVR